MGDRPDIQLIANVVITNDRGEVLLTRYRDDDPRWWLPGSELDPYEHPDQACARALADLGITASPRLHHIESFRGRRGWHVMFNYHCEAAATNAQGQWHATGALPATTHGEWERGVIGKVLQASVNGLR
jgi:ADP-ribose pyrophosphatase YjhB (NUDIX family)